MNVHAPTSDHRTRRSLFPENEPLASGWLTTDDGHEVYFEECGAAGGKPCVILHGGPGGAINPTMRRFFDPKRWRMTLFDQRGCGRSRPHASLERNTTWTLIEDIERLRVRAGIERWTGVRRLLGFDPGARLRRDAPGASGRPDPARRVPVDQKGAGLVLSGRRLNAVSRRVGALRGPDPGGGAGRSSHRLPSPSDPPGPPRTRRGRRRLEPVEGDTISIRGPEARPAKFNEEDFAVAFARIESHFFVNGGFFDRDGWLLDQVETLRRIPGWIVQGRFDVVTPLQSAWVAENPLAGGQF